MKLVALVLFTLVGCGGDGSAPVVSNLAVGPLTVPVGPATAITGSIRFMDSDGDVDQIAAAVTFAGTRTEVGPETIQPSPGDVEVGSVAVGLSLAPPVAGTYELEVWLLDEADNKSNKLTVSVTAQ